MGVMFQEQSAALEKQIVGLKRELATSERQAERMAGLWREQQAKAGAHEKTLEAQAGQIVSLERQLVDHRSVAGRLADAEKEAGDAVKRLARAEKALATAEESLLVVGAARDGLRESLAEATGERDRLRAEIGPFRALIGALKARAAVDAEIAQEIGRLDA